MSNFKDKIKTTLKKSVLDPQGQTVLHALHTLEFEEAKSLRIGKYFELVLEAASKTDAEKSVRAMCDKLLHNAVIESYDFELDETSEAVASS